MPPSFYIGIFLLIFGITATLFVYYKYTREAHKKEMDKYQFMKNDWNFNFDLNLFIRLGEKSFILAKMIIMLLCFAFAALGAFFIWDSLVH